MSLIGNYANKIIFYYQDKVINSAVGEMQNLKAISKRDLKDEPKDPFSHLKAPHATRVVVSISMICLTALVGALFYGFNEDWDAGSALYYCFITTLTIGYGELNITKQSSRLFSVFYILASVTVATLAIGQLSKVYFDVKMEKKKLSVLERGLSLDYLKKLQKADQDGDQKISKLEYIIEIVSQLHGIDKEKDLMPWLNKFDEFDVSKDGYLDLEDLEKQILQTHNDSCRSIALDIRTRHNDNHSLSNIIHDLCVLITKTITDWWVTVVEVMLMISDKARLYRKVDPITNEDPAPGYKETGN
jgi:hypothetical protein